MLTKLNKREDGEAELIVELPSTELNVYLRAAEAKLAQSFKADGFRPGRVPLEVLRREIGDRPILQAGLELAVEDSLPKALRQERLEVISSADLKILVNSAEKLKYSVKLLLFPKVELGPYQNLKLVNPTVKVEEKEVMGAIDFLRRSHAVWQAADGPAVNGYRLEVDFEISDQGQLIEGGKSENHPFVLGEKNFVPGFEEQIVGLRAGETKQFSLLVPSDHFQQSIAGKNLDFKVMVKSIKQPLQPELTDQFARSLGEFSTVQDLQKSVAQGLKQEKEEKEKQKIRLKILEEIDRHSQISVPSRLVEQRLQEMVADFDQSLHQRGLELSLYLARLKKTEAELKAEWRPQAEKQIRHQLLIRAVGQKEGIEVDQREARQAAQALASQLILRGGEKAAIDLAILEERAHLELMKEKVWSFLERTNILSGSDGAETLADS